MNGLDGHMWTIPQRVGTFRTYSTNLDAIINYRFLMSLAYGVLKEAQHITDQVNVIAFGPLSIFAVSKLSESTSR